MQTNLEGKEALPLVDPVKGYLACWSPAGGVMGPCVHCARSPYRLRASNSVFNNTTCWGRVGYHKRDSSNNDINKGNEDAKAQFIYVPHKAVSQNPANKVARFIWTHPWFHEAAALVKGCGDEAEVGCDHAYRLCCHCWNHGGSNCKRKWTEGSLSARGIMKKKYVTRNGTVIM
jgi:hypothetical protein